MVGGDVGRVRHPECNQAELNTRPKGAHQPSARGTGAIKPKVPGELCNLEMVGAHSSPNKIQSVVTRSDMRLDLFGGVWSPQGRQREIVVSRGTQGENLAHPTGHIAVRRRDSARDSYPTACRTMDQQIGCDRPRWKCTD